MIMIDLTSEKLIPLREVPHLDFMPTQKSGSRLSVSTAPENINIEVWFNDLGKPPLATAIATARELKTRLVVEVIIPVRAFAP
ncbi:MAG TPA: hypothetical protein PLN21_16910 [Gemmatales bacterium]|nr:hypothetical protein [Gemmatales bacterium]